MQPPKVSFISQIYHPAVDMDGRICLDYLRYYRSTGGLEKSGKNSPRFSGFFNPSVNLFILDFRPSLWNPFITIEKLLLAICSLLSDPILDSPLVPAIGKLTQVSLSHTEFSKCLQDRSQRVQQNCP